MSSRQLPTVMLSNSMCLVCLDCIGNTYHYWCIIEVTRNAALCSQCERVFHSPKAGNEFMVFALVPVNRRSRPHSTLDDLNNVPSDANVSQTDVSVVSLCQPNVLFHPHDCEMRNEQCLFTSHMVQCEVCGDVHVVHHPLLLARIHHVLHEPVCCADSMLSTEVYYQQAVYLCPDSSEDQEDDDSIIVISEDDEDDGGDDNASDEDDVTEDATYC